MSKDDEYKDIKEQMGYRRPIDYYKYKKVNNSLTLTEKELDEWTDDHRKLFDLDYLINHYKNKIISFLKNKGIPELHPTHNTITIDKEAHIYINGEYCSKAISIGRKPWSKEGYIRLKGHYSEYEERKSHILDDGTIKVGSCTAGLILKNFFSYMDGVEAAGESLDYFWMLDNSIKENNLKNSVIFALRAMSYTNQLAELNFLDGHLDHQNQHGKKENKEARIYAAKRWKELEQKIEIEKRGNIKRIKNIIFDELCELSRTKKGLCPPARSTFDGWFKGEQRKKTLAYYKPF